MCYIQRMSKRKSRDEFYLSIAWAVAGRSTCLRVPQGVGCILVNSQDSIIATGYVGSMRKAQHCTDVGCLINNGGCVRTVHAEMNAIANAARNGTSTFDCTVYTTLSPCRACMMNLVNAGAKRFVYAQMYRLHDHLNELESLGIEKKLIEVQP